ncbi:phosphoadenosine phosphosulfate reductase family protein [Ruminiclostridium josui]|uniref:phosphoadenosine phosphosulfate reductase family protein n=1 Tax=Ruminiclostridium josui TaxID=1499 RepID=UPI000462E97D|nr:phosphoadenosine phosphosulfate reductase family protein [Ruminiclostridium josui]
MNVVSFGGGTNSTAMLIGMWEKKMPVDLILFADTGCEMPHTYEHVEIMSKWLKEHKMPEITVVGYTDKNGKRFTLEDECLRSCTLPSLAYGFKKCSLKHKKGVQDKYCNSYQPCIDVWSSGKKVNKFIGYDAGEEQRRDHAWAADMLDKKYCYNYLLIDWEWYRDDCINKIKQYNIPLPGKSSCFCCPSMKKPEIKVLKKTYPDLFDRAIAIEDNAKKNLLTVKGLGRNYSWKDYIESVEAQLDICSLLDDEDLIPCGCYDG